MRTAEVTEKSHRRYRVELDPTAAQREAFVRHCGATRWAYNFGLRRSQEEYAAGRKRPTAYDLAKEVVLLKRRPVEDGGAPWLASLSKWVTGTALIDLEQAFKRFFARCKSGAKCKGYPRFKSRKSGVGSFRVYQVKAEHRRVYLPIIGWVRLKERGYIPAGKNLSATVIEYAGRWYVSVLISEPARVILPARGDVLGIDLGIATLATLSDGTTYENPRALVAAERRLRARQKSVSRKQRGSANRRKSVRRLARAHARVAAIRNDHIHKMTHAITKRASCIVVEDLNVEGMVQNHKLARAIGDASMGEVLRQLKYKAAWRGVTLIEAPRFYPSSKTCSACGSVKEALSLATRTYSCEACGLIIDRDLNAALNLQSLAAGSAVTACRHGSTGLGREAQVKLPFGQEPELGAA